MPLILTNKDKCNLSYTCIRVCPAKAIKIENDYAHIIENRCIGCGNCVTVCAQAAIEYRNSEDQVKMLLSGNDPVVAICDPSISGEFDDILDYRNFVGMIRALGFDYVVEAAFGADLVAYKYKKLFDNFHGKYYISTKCPALVNQVENFHPDLVENLAPIVPPNVAMAKVVRKKYGKNTKVVSLSPCVASKNDVKFFNGSDGDIHAVLSFVELRKLFKEYDITENSVEFSEFDPPFARLGGLFPISHGLFQAADIDVSMLNGGIISTEGRNNFLRSINEFKTQHNLNQHLDLFYCEGCIMGPGASAGGRKFSRRSQVIRYVRKRLKTFDEEQWQKEIDEYKNLDLNRGFKSRGQNLPIPSEEEVYDVLVEMGKEKVEDQLGCGSCGYESCREFAIAKCQGLANFEMCSSYTIKNMNSVIKELNITNSKLSQTKTALKESERIANEERVIAQEASETVSAMLQKLPSGVVIVDENLKVIESNTSFVNLLGDEARMLSEIIPGLVDADLTKLIPFHKLFSTVILNGEDILNKDVHYGNALFNVSVFTIKKNKIVGGIIRDLYAPEVRKEEVIGRARAVIKENLQTVQQIAFLLGESASKTEKLMNSIIKSHTPGDKESTE
ncbi:[Fe-Fe] hydrogenase large subunit C-terminal domain-containing protein [Marinifilum sp. D737]|uniref:[Fe-Fe] hydrogenase large subunit C-terminal domain-containing protein n=1 Tax=Marinifilum sp. D737 TaxID=2969628 RepID=UPI002275E1B2|nr:[Fe-Fe] hydrogenase large subunit C-terminal domain-containing protein [Marinifilum sp. D737]MCY1633576.1 4Fe-4S binding protein [Marinifilum sp. D737]